MKTRILLVLISTAIVLYGAACGPIPTAPAAQPPTAATSSGAEAVSTQTPTAATGPTSTTQPTQSPVELVWTIPVEPKQSSIPDGVAVDRQGNLFVADSGQDRIQKFDSEGHIITTWGSAGKGNGQFDCRDFCMLAVDAQGNVYVTDNDNARVQKFDNRGKFLTKWGSPGSSDGQFNGPFGVAVDGQSNVYIGDVGNARVEKFDSDGKFLSKFGMSGSGGGGFSSQLADLAIDA